MEGGRIEREREFRVCVTERDVISCLNYVCEKK